MKRPVKLAIILGVAVAVVTVAALLNEEKKKTDMLDKIADEGYETAFDVLYPNHKRKQRKQHYGPIL
jgi:hypothetical protein